jgi:hypothetical protein
MLKDEVLHLTTAGVLKSGNYNALLVKLDGAYKKSEDSDPKTAVNKMRAFANQVSAFVRTGRTTFGRGLWNYGSTLRSSSSQLGQVEES